MLSEWKVDPGAKWPDPNEMTDFNVLTLHAKTYPGTMSLVCSTGDRVRIRIGNLSATSVRARRRRTHEVTTQVR